MIAALATFALRLGVPKGLARLAAIAALAIGAIAVFMIARAMLREAIIDRHEAKAEAQLQRAGRAADAVSAEQRQRDASRLAEEARQLERTGKDGEAADLASDRRRYYRCIRLQQAAREDGERPPACN